MDSREVSLYLISHYELSSICERFIVFYWVINELIYQTVGLRYKVKAGYHIAPSWMVLK